MVVGKETDPGPPTEHMHVQHDVQEKMSLQADSRSGQEAAPCTGEGLYSQQQSTHHAQSKLVRALAPKRLLLSKRGGKKANTRRRVAETRLPHQTNTQLMSPTGAPAQSEAPQKNS